MFTVLYPYIYIYIPIPFHYSSKERASSALSIAFHTNFMYTILFELFKKTLFLTKSLRVYPTKFHENFHISESHENWYIEVIGHAEHESRLSFLITKISNTISPLII